MAADEDRNLADEALRALADEDAESSAAFEELAARVEEPTLQETILRRYLSYGKDLLSDTHPGSLDPRMARELEPILGDVSRVRVHTGPLATEAARAMDARAFAIGDQDVFVDSVNFDATSEAGRGLLAHEVAHTRDAATGFAMSAEQAGSSRGRAEAFAEGVERAHQQAQNETPATGTRSQATKLDKNRLAQMIVDVMKRQASRGNERTGS